MTLHNTTQICGDNVAAAALAHRAGGQQMTRQLPANSVDLLNGQHEAQNIAQSCSVAYWMHGRDDHNALYHLNAIHTQFAKLADKLGYTIAPKEVAPVEVAA